MLVNLQGPDSCTRRDSQLTHWFRSDAERVPYFLEIPPTSLRSSICLRRRAYDSKPLWALKELSTSAPSYAILVCCNLSLLWCTRITVWITMPINPVRHKLSRNIDIRKNHIRELWILWIVNCVCEKSWDWCLSMVGELTSVLQVTQSYRTDVSISFFFLIVSLKT